MRTRITPHLMTALLLGTAAVTPAATRTWNGGGSNGFWSNADNWNGVTPAAGDDLVFPGGASVDPTSLSNTNDFASLTAFNWITISGSNYQLFGNSVALTNGLSCEGGGTNRVRLNLRLKDHQNITGTDAAGSLVVSGEVDLNGFNLNAVVSGFVEVAGPISGTGDVSKSGNGTLMFSGTLANTYAGFTFVNAGTLLLNKSPGTNAVPTGLVIGDGLGGADADVVRLRANSQLADQAAITIASSGLLDTAGFLEISGPPSGSGKLHINGSSFSVISPPGTVTFDGVISGSGNLVQVGSGTWMLNGSNSYAGSCTVNSTMAVNGTLPTSSISVYGTLGGTGLVQNVLMGGSGMLSPGLSPGSLNVSNITFVSTSTLRVELDGTTPGSGYDQLRVTGPVDLTNSMLDVALGFNPAGGESFTIIDNDGGDAVAGTFSGLPEGALFDVGTNKMSITYAGGSGNDVVLTAVLPSLLVVSNLNDGGNGSLRQVVADALPGDTIVFAEGLAGAIALTNGELIVSKSLTIAGPGADVVGISGGNLSRVVHVTGGKLSLSGLMIRNGLAAGADGAFGQAGDSVLGGGILNEGTLCLTACVVSNNLAEAGKGGDNGGIGGMAEGGGIASLGPLSMTNCTVRNNQARGGNGGGGGGGGAAGGDGNGGGIYSETELSLFRCAIVGNSAVGGNASGGGGGSPHGLARGGGIKVSGTADLTLCTFFANSVTSQNNARGGAVENGAVTTLHSCTFAGNDAQNTGGGLEQNGTLTVQNSIIALNQANSRPDVSGTVVSAGHNLLGSNDGTSGWGATGDQVGVNPMLWLLGDYGGPTPTIALRWGSPAMDKGNSSGVDSDQRGVARYDDPTLANATGGDGTDIGAYEAAELRIVEWNKSGDDFNLTHTSVRDVNYHVLSRTNVASGGWVTNLSNLPGNGGVNQVTLTNEATGQQLYLRVLGLP